MTARVTNFQGYPVSNATVDIVNLESGAPELPQTTTNAVTGSCIPPGHYRVTARLGTLEASEDVVLTGAGESVMLRLPTTTVSPETSKPVVSVADLKVPEKARKALEKAQEKLRARDVSAALRLVEEAIKMAPNYSAAYQLRGLLNLTQEKLNDAIDDLDHAIKLDSGNTMARIILGSAYNNTKRFADAARTLEGALPLAPTSWQAQFELGKAYAGLGRVRESLASLTRAMELNPKYPEIRYARGFVLLHAGQSEDAAADLKQYLHDAPNGRDAGRAKELLASIAK